MARTFHLSCNGPLDTSEDAMEALSHALSRLISDPRTLDRLLLATTIAPCRINTPNGTLAEARSMDSALMAIGLFSEIFVRESSFPDHPGIFINEREGSRRGAPPSDLSEEPETPSITPGRELRGRKGRRSSDR
jgi:hypothetical protein